WHARANDGSSAATKLAASLAISPRMQGPSHERTGIFFSEILRFAYTSPAGQKPLTPCTATEKSGVKSTMLTSLRAGRSGGIPKDRWDANRKPTRSTHLV